jgi:dihydrofolate reductase
MRISQIVAMAANRVIGDRGLIPWKIPGEQKMFKEITMGHTVIMGRKTYESLNRPLPGRTNIVVTRQRGYRCPGCRVAHHLAEALDLCPAAEEEAFICGGGQLYREAMPMTDRIYLTVISRKFAGDTFYPEFPADEFEIVQSKRIEGVLPYRFYIYERIRGGCRLDPDGAEGADGCDAKRRIP